MAFFQIPTPESSHSPPPISEETSVFPVSAVFNPKASSDLVILSSDTVLFYLDSRILLAASEDAFRKLLPAPLSSIPLPTVIGAPDSTEVLNVIFHVIYNMSCIPQSPSFQNLVTAVNKMPLYGFDPKEHIIQSHPIYGHLLSFAPLFPHGLYTLASHFDIHELAAAASSYLLSSSLYNITDDMAQRMGPIYLKRLFSLHAQRLHMLKSTILRPPGPHPPTPECSFAQQKQLEDIWAAGLADLAWDVMPDLTMHRLRTAFNLHAGSLSCEACQDTLTDRLNDVLAQWAMMARTI